VSSEDLAKGYEFRKGEFVQLDPSEIAAVRPPSTHIIGISRVIPLADLDPIYVERPYFVAPDSEDAGHPFAVIREALDSKAAIGTVTIHGREDLVAIVPRDRGLVMLTLRRSDELRDIAELPELEFGRVKTDAAETRLATRVLESFPSDMDVSAYTDEYEVALRQIVANKVAGRAILAPGPEKPAKVVNLMDALRQSLAAAASRHSRESAQGRAKVLPHRPKAQRVQKKPRRTSRARDRMRRAR
jgi:DNA end-binding protein Ku